MKSRQVYQAYVKRREGGMRLLQLHYLPSDNQRKTSMTLFFFTKTIGELHGEFDGSIIPSFNILSSSISRCFFRAGEMG